MSNTFNTDKQHNQPTNESNIIDQFTEQAKALAHLKSFNTVVIDSSNVCDVKALYESLLRRE